MSNEELLELLKESMNLCIAVHGIIETLAEKGYDDSTALSLLANTLDKAFGNLILIETELS